MGTKHPLTFWVIGHPPVPAVVPHNRHIATAIATTLATSVLFSFSLCHHHVTTIAPAGDEGKCRREEKNHLLSFQSLVITDIWLIPSLVYRIQKAYWRYLPQTFSSYMPPENLTSCQSDSTIQAFLILGFNSPITTYLIQIILRTIGPIPDPNF